MSRDFRDLIKWGGVQATWDGDNAFLRLAVADPAKVSVSPWVIELRDINNVKVHEVEAGSFTGVIRRNSPGQWRLQMPLNEMPDSVLGSVAGVRVRDGRRTLFTGWVSPLASAGGGITRTVSTSQRSVVIEGVDAWWPLMTRLVFPDPSKYSPWSVATDERTGVASNVAGEFIAHNLGASALTDRSIDIVLVDPGVGASGTWSARLAKLGDVVGRICDEADMVCVPSIDDQGRPLFRFRLESDRSDSVVLADDDDLVDTTWSVVPPRATWVLAAGTGDGATREFRSNADGLVGGFTAASLSDGAAVYADDTGIRRVEMLTEQPNAETAGQLVRIAEAVRRDESTVMSVSGVLSATVAARLRYGVDYELGDLLGVQVAGERFASPVMAVTFEASPDRFLATPTLGTWSPDRMRGLRRDVLGLADRFNRGVN